MKYIRFMAPGKEAEVGILLEGTGLSGVILCSRTEEGGYDGLHKTCRYLRRLTRAAGFRMFGRTGI